MKKTGVILILTLLAGCGGGLSSSWNNFTAYYNTFYNAKNNFKVGLKKVEEQPIQVNPDAPIRVHRAPVNAGSEDFEEAINNGALILRRHADSKWTDNALLLIGKSYYYQQEFFLAIQTFEQLIDADSPSRLKQEAILWKGRALLDIASYGEGISFLETQLADLGSGWDASLAAKVRIILAEHYAMLENWQQSARILEPAILDVEDRDLKGRSYFLLGQVFEFQGDLTRAYQAYSNVESNFPDYEYIYWANIKRAEVSRLSGNPGLAVSIYRSMLNDDKNFDRRNSLYFELAQTYEQEGNMEQAEAIYKDILNNPQSERSSLLADTYYQLGQLYSREYSNYRLAAAYYDSSSSLSRQVQNASDEEAAGLASAYGEYVFLKKEIARIDSLIQLGELNEEELDSVLTEVRRQKRAMLQNTQANAEQAENTLSNIGQDTSTNPAGPGAESSTFGFLNYRNARMVEAAQQQFRARWGSRPLVDNWRRTNAILSTGSGNQSTVPDTPEVIGNEVTGRTDQQLGINLKEIPLSLQAKREKRIERLNLQYRLGNLFFLTLDEPDSARYYFKKVLADTISSSIEPQALYSLFRLYELEGKADSAAYYKQRIFAEYPGSVYAERIRKGKDGADLQSAADSTAQLRDKVQKLIVNQRMAPPSAARAEQFQSLALENRNSPLAPTIFYEGIKELVRVAKVPDSTATDTAGTKIEEFPRKNTLTYSGEKWDRVRNSLADFQQLFPNASQMQKVNQWLEVIGASSQETIATCGELGITPKVKPDMQTFLQIVELPERLQGLNLSGSLSYRLVITREGRVKSFGLLSKPTNLGIEEAYEQAIKNDLQFEPVIYQGKAIPVSCEVKFPIKQ